MSVLYPVIEHLTGRQGLKVGLIEVIAGADRPRRSVLRALDKLAAEGWLEEVAGNPVRPGFGQCGPARRDPTWKILRDPAERPRQKPSRNTLRQKIWHLIRSKRHFTKQDLVIASGAAEPTVDEYVRELERGGHIRRTGKDGRKVTYLLITTRIERPLPGGLHGK